MLQHLTLCRKQIISERDQLLHQLDLTYINYINQLLQQKYVITRSIQNQYNGQITNIDDLLLFYNINANIVENASTHSVQNINQNNSQILATPSIKQETPKQKTPIKQTTNRHIHINTPTLNLPPLHVCVSSLNDETHKPRKYQWKDTKLLKNDPNNTSLLATDIRQLLMNRGHTMPTKFKSKKKSVLIKLLTENYNVGIGDISTFTWKAICVELKLHGLMKCQATNCYTKKDVLIECYNKYMATTYAVHPPSTMSTTTVAATDLYTGNISPDSFHLFGCARCQQSFKTYQELRYHISISHLNAARTIQMDEQNQNNGKYECDLCLKLFARKTSYSHHYVLSNHKLIIHNIHVKSLKKLEWKDTVINDCKNNTSVVKAADINQLLATRGARNNLFKHLNKAQKIEFLKEKYEAEPPEQLSMLTVIELIAELRLRGLSDKAAKKDILIRRLNGEIDDTVVTKTITKGGISHGMCRATRSLETICVECLKKDAQKSIIKCAKCYSGYHTQCITNGSAFVNARYICQNCVDNTTTLRPKRLRNKPVVMYEYLPKPTCFKKKNNSIVSMQRLNTNILGHKRKEPPLLSVDQQTPKTKKIKTTFPQWWQ